MYPVAIPLRLIFFFPESQTGKLDEAKMNEIINKNSNVISYLKRWKELQEHILYTAIAIHLRILKRMVHFLKKYPKEAEN